MESQEKSTVGSHVNGWTTISRYLKIRSKNQSDLARKLQISPAAISQIKTGSFRLNSSQLGVIASYLEIDESGLSDLYTELFAGRMADPDHAVQREDVLELRCVAKKRSILQPGIPVGELPILDDFCPAVEPLHQFVRHHSPERSRLYVGDDICAIRIPEDRNGRDLPAGAMLILVERYPEAGEMVLARCGNGEYMLREFQPDTDAVRFRHTIFSGNEIIWSFRDDPLWVSWIRPVIQVELNVHG